MFGASALRQPLYTRTTVPKDWSLVGAASETNVVSFVLALQQQNLDILKKLATDVSNPKSLSYQEYMSIADISKIVSPSKDVQDSVIASLISYGVNPKDIINRGDAIDVRTSVEVASKFFDTKFFNFVHTEGKRQVVRANGAYSVPESIQAVVKMAAGISTFPIPHLSARKHFKDTVKHNLRTAATVAAPTTDSDYYFVPQSVYQLYDYKEETFSSALSTSHGVIQFEAQYYDDTDLTAYATGTGVPVVNPVAATTVGVNFPSSPGVEAQLDVEAMGTSNNEGTMWFWIEGGTGWMYTFTSHFYATEVVPQVISISYAWSELDNCQAGIGGDDCAALGVDSETYVAMVNTEFQKIALRGISVLVASGDSGANGRTNGFCDYSTSAILRPDFPASSPWVTSVGGTELVNMTPLENPPAICTGLSLQCAGTGTEVAVSISRSYFASGGGFSWYAEQPIWQADVVNAYLAQNATSGALPPSTFFNGAGRAFPDVSAMGHNFLMDIYGISEGVGGTSVASPLLGGFVSLLNQVSIKMTGTTLGFINPFLYQMYADEPSIFNDVVVGDNICTEYGCQPSCQGFKAATGWDAVTGLGSMRYKATERYVKKMLAASIAAKAAAKKV